jgi:hypothetical protein
LFAVNELKSLTKSRRPFAVQGSGLGTEDKRVPPR